MDDASKRSDWFRVIAWAITIAITCLAGVGLRDYRVDNNLNNWFPQLKAIGDDRPYIVVGGEWSDLNVDPLRSALVDQPEIAFVLNPRNVAVGSMIAGLDGAGMNEAFRVDPANFVVSGEGDYAAVFAFGHQGVSAEELVAAAHRAMESAEVERSEVALGGSAVFETELNHASQQRLPIIMSTAFLLGAITLRMVVGSWRSTLEAVAAIACSIIMLFGVLSWINQSIDMVVSIVPPLMMAMGYSYASHRTLHREVTRPLMLSLLTTIAGFIGLAFAPVDPIRRFAIVAIVGLLLVWACMFLLVTPRPLRRQPGRLSRMTKRLHFTAVTSNRRIVLAVSMVITVLGLVSIPLLTSDPDPLSYFSRDSDIVRDTHTLERRVTGMLPSQVVITGDVDAGKAVAMLEADAHVVKVLPTLDTSQRELMFWCLSNQSDLPHLSDAATRWRTTIVRQGGELEWRGVAAQLVAADHAVRNVAASSLLGMVMIAGLLVGINARSVRIGLVSIWVNVMPVLFLILLFAATRTAISLPTFMIGAIAIGIGLDDTIHMLARRQGFREGRMRTVFRLRRACAGSSVVAAVTLLPLMASPFRPTAEFGVTLAIAILVALLADLFLLPVFLTESMAYGSGWVSVHGRLGHH